MSLIQDGLSLIFLKILLTGKNISGPSNNFDYN